jgi:hypothetical protein
MFGCILNCMLEAKCLLGCGTVSSVTLEPVAVIFRVESFTKWYHIPDVLGNRSGGLGSIPGTTRKKK